MEKSRELIKPSFAPVIERAGESSYQPSFNHPPEASDSAHHRLREYLLAARKHLGIIISVVVLCSMLAATYMARQPDVFEARSRVQVDLENTSPGLGSLRSGSVILNTPSFDPAYFNTQLEILSSTGLLGRVVKTLDLEHNQAFLNPNQTQTRSTWHNLRRMFGFRSNDDKPTVPDVERVEITSSNAPATDNNDLVEVNRLAPYVGILQGSLTVKQIGETRLIELRYRHSDAELAAKILNAIADAYVLSNLENKSASSGDTSSFLQRRIAELQLEIRRGEERLINYANSKQILSLDGTQNIVVERLAALNSQLTEAENARKTAEAVYRAALAPNAIAARVNAGSGGSNSLVQTLNAQLASLRQKRAQLLLRYTEEWGEVKDVEKQIAVIESQVKEAGQTATATVATNLETDYRQALAKEQAIRADFNQQRGETLTQNEAAITYRIIQQETATNKELLDSLLQKQKENDVVIAGTPNNAHVVDYAAVPRGAVGPRRLQTVFFVSIIALAFGVGLARYLEFLDNTVQTTDDVMWMLNLPTLAVIPVIASSAKRRLIQGMTTALQRREEGGGGSELLLHNQDPRSPLAEAYRQLRTSILLSSAGGAPQTLLVTSSQPSEGKTTTAFNTAQILSQVAPNVLLIDADMRRPRLHNLFDINNSRGLSTLLASDMDDAEIFSMITKDGQSNLHVLTSGPVPPNPAELLGSEQMRRLLETLRGTYTHVIIDSPPIATFTDGVLLSTMVDGVLLVVHSGVALRNVVLRSREMLQNVGAHIFGVVLNKVGVREHGSYYDTYYAHHYYQEVDPTLERPGSTLQS